MFITSQIFGHRYCKYHAISRAHFFSSRAVRYYCRYAHICDVVCWRNKKKTIYNYGESSPKFLRYETNRFNFLVFCLFTKKNEKSQHLTSSRTVLFLFFSRHDLICDLLACRRTKKYNLFVKQQN